MGMWGCPVITVGEVSTPGYPFAAPNWRGRSRSSVGTGTGWPPSRPPQGRIRGTRRPAEMMNFGRPDARRPLRRHDGGTAATTRVRASHPADVPVARTRAHDDPRNAGHRPV